MSPLLSLSFADMVRVNVPSPSPISILFADQLAPVIVALPLVMLLEPFLMSYSMLSTPLPTSEIVPVSDSGLVMKDSSFAGV